MNHLQKQEIHYDVNDRLLCPTEYCEYHRKSDQGLAEIVCLHKAFYVFVD